MLRAVVYTHHMEATTWENVGTHTTSDGKIIFRGLQVWNSNFEEDVVVEPVRYGNPAEAQWFTTEKGIFDGSRLSVRRPF